MIYISLDTNFLNISRYNNLERFELNSDFYEIYDVSKNKECIDKCEVLLPELVYRELLQHEIEAYRKIYDAVEQYAMQLKDLFSYNFQHTPEQYAIELSRLADQYLTKEKIKILPVCSDDQFLNILEASIKKQPPFEGIKGKADKGFKDAVIWFSLMDYAKDHPGKYIFVTKDKIFLDNKNKLYNSFEEKTRQKVTFYRDLEEVRQNIIEFSAKSELQEVEVSVQEKEWEIYDKDRVMINTAWTLPVVKTAGRNEEPHALKYINHCIRNYYEDVKQEWISWKQELAKSEETTTDGEKEPYSDGIAFEILLNQASILCIRFSRYRYTGGWHGLPIWNIMTFDLSTGRQLELKDVMNLSEDKIFELAARRLKEEQAICKNTNRRPYIMEDFTLKYYHNSRELKWFVDLKGVHIYFDVYEASSYSEGFIDILLSDRVYKKQGKGKILLKLEKELNYEIRS